MTHELTMGEDGILRNKIIGDVDKIAIDGFLRDFNQYLNAATDKAPINMIVYSSDIGKLTSVARRAFMEMNADSRFGKVAMLNAPRMMRVFAGFVAKATSRKNIEFFEEEGDAIRWLKDKAYA